MDALLDVGGCGVVQDRVQWLFESRRLGYARIYRIPRGSYWLRKDEGRGCLLGVLVVFNVFQDARVERVARVVGFEGVQENLVEAAEFGFRGVNVERVVVSDRVRPGRFFVRALVIHRISCRD